VIKENFLIPNQLQNIEKEKRNDAFAGIREPILDCLAAAFDIAVAINYIESGYNKNAIFLTEDNIKKCKQLEKPHEGVLRLCKAKRREITNKYIEQCYDGKGWSCKIAIVQVKREFVSQSQDAINPRKYLELVQEASDLKDVAVMK
jgi:hypothetical protein